MSGRKLTAINEAQRDDFWANGYLVVENAVAPDLLQALKRDFASWVEDSRDHRQAYGDTLDGRPRFDLEQGHSSETPKLRRVNAPIEVSEAYFQAMADSRMTDCVADLIGPNVKLHHSKINSKLPDSRTEVKWHQDFPFTPHSNDDIITALLMVDAVDEENGPLEVIPGSHKGELYSLWHGGVFTGAVSPEINARFADKAISCTGSAGSVCLMHTRLLHGSAANRSPRARTLFITVYTAEDAVPCSPNPMPTRHEGLIVRGQKTNRIRAIRYDIERPEMPKTASFFDQQDREER